MCRWKVIVFPHFDGKRVDSYIAKLARIATVRVVMWRGSTGVKRCGVALTLATTPAPVRNLSPSWVVSLSVATSFDTTSVGGTVSRYICVRLWLQSLVLSPVDCSRYSYICTYQRAQLLPLQTQTHDCCFPLQHNTTFTVSYIGIKTCKSSETKGRHTWFLRFNHHSTPAGANWISVWFVASADISDAILTSSSIFISHHTGNQTALLSSNMW